MSRIGRNEMSTFLIRHDSKQLARRNCAVRGEQSMIYIAWVTKQAFGDTEASRGLGHDSPKRHCYLPEGPESPCKKQHKW